MIQATHPDCMNRKHRQFIAMHDGYMKTLCYDCGLQNDRQKAVQRIMDTMNLLPANTPDRDIHIISAAWGHQ